MKQNILKILYFGLICFFAIAGIISFRILPESDLNIPLLFPSPTIVIPIVNHSSSETAKVIRVIDGDTIEIENNKIVRYIGIDTPETKHPNKSVQCFGKEASDFNKQLVTGKTIQMKKDVSEVDKYKRLLRYVWIADSENATQSGIFVNDYLVRQGFAYAAAFPPDIAYSKQFIEAQREAREHNRGLWDKCNN